jgi:type 1 glutamine amidotransferase
MAAAAQSPPAVSEAERRQIEAAIPGKPAVKPGKARRLLVLDANIGRRGHPSIPYANLALELMGKRTGAYEAVFSNDPALLTAEKLRTFDAVYFNNTIGPIFNTPELREAFLGYIREGGGMAGNHALPFTSTDWPEFSLLVGAKNGYHREPTEKVAIRVDDPASPINAAFRGRSVEFTDEFFRFFDAPYAPERLHILLSIDVERTNMSQGQCGGTSTKPYPPSVRCTRPDNLYPISWVRSEGKGRVFYCSMGHNQANFWNPVFLEHLLAGIQFALGDLRSNP